MGRRHTLPGSAGGGRAADQPRQLHPQPRPDRYRRRKDGRARRLLRKSDGASRPPRSDRLRRARFGDAGSPGRDQLRPQLPPVVGRGGEDALRAGPAWESITFDKATQQFSFPRNTRFYKTFLKKVIDATARGFSARSRRASSSPVPTRTGRTTPPRRPLFLAATSGTRTRPRRCCCGSAAQWQAVHRQGAHLHRERAQLKELQDRTQGQFGVRPGAGARGVAPLCRARRYAASSATWAAPAPISSLGFTPLQIHRRPTGEPRHLSSRPEDELNQLQRFIDYGIVTGIGSPSEVLPLEQSQGSRKPRTGEELGPRVHDRKLRRLPQPAGIPHREEQGAARAAELPARTARRRLRVSTRALQPPHQAWDNLDELIPYITPSLRDSCPDRRTSTLRSEKWYAQVGMGQVQPGVKLAAVSSMRPGGARSTGTSTPPSPTPTTWPYFPACPGTRPASTAGRRGSWPSGWSASRPGGRSR